MCLTSEFIGLLLQIALFTCFIEDTPDIYCHLETGENCGLTHDRKLRENWLKINGSSLSSPIKDHTINHGKT